MPNVVIKVLGSSPKEINASTVGEVKRTLSLRGHTANVNGDPASDEQSLNENDFVTLSPSVKGGR